MIWLWGLATITVAPPGEWETLIADENLLIERRPYAGSALKEIRGVTRIQSSLSAAVALLRDARFNPQWVYRSGGATVLQANGDSSAYVYGVVDAPWPIQDRDTVVRFNYQQDPFSKTITISIRNLPADYPRQKEICTSTRFWRLLETEARARRVYQGYLPGLRRPWGQPARLVSQSGGSLVG